MECGECGCWSETMPGWVALLARDLDDEDEPPSVVFYCPPCAAREFDYEPRAGYT